MNVGFNSSKLISCWLLAAFLGLPGSVFGQQPSAVIDLGTRRELFVDRFLIDKLTGAELRLQTPRDEGNVLAFDKPWEGAFCAYVTILKDQGKYRAYYRGHPPTRRNNLLCRVGGWQDLDQAESGAARCRGHKGEQRHSGQDRAVHAQLLPDD